MSQAVALRISKVWTRSPVLFWLFAHGEKRRQDQSIRVLHEFTQRVIRTRRQQLIDDAENESSATTTPSIAEDGVKAKYALLDILLRSAIDGEPLSDADIQEEVDTFMFEVCKRCSARFGAINPNDTLAGSRYNHIGNLFHNAPAVQAQAGAG